MKRALTAWALAGALAGGNFVRAADDQAKAAEAEKQHKALEAQIAKLQAELVAMKAALADRQQLAGRLHGLAALDGDQADAFAKLAQVRARAAMEHEGQLLEQQHDVEAALKQMEQRLLVDKAGAVRTTAAAGKEEVFLGVITEPAGEALAAQLALPGGKGLVVMEVVGDSPAAKAGLKKFDVVVTVNGQALGTPEELKKLVVARKVGENLALQIRSGAQAKNVSVALAGRKNPNLGKWQQFNGINRLSFLGRGKALQELEALAKKRPEDKDLAAALDAAKKAMAEISFVPMEGMDWGDETVRGRLLKIAAPKPPKPPKPPTAPHSAKSKDHLSVSLSVNNGAIALSIGYQLEDGKTGNANFNGANAEEVRAAVEKRKDLPPKVLEAALKALSGLSTEGGKQSININQETGGDGNNIEVRVQGLPGTIEVKKGQ